MDDFIEVELVDVFVLFMFLEDVGSDVVISLIVGEVMWDVRMVDMVVGWIVVIVVGGII